MLLTMMLDFQQSCQILDEEFVYFMSAWRFHACNFRMCVGMDSFLFTFFAARMNTFKETYAFQVMEEDVNEGGQDLG